MNSLVAFTLCAQRSECASLIQNRCLWTQRGRRTRAAYLLRGSHVAPPDCTGSAVPRACNLVRRGKGLRTATTLLERAPPVSILRRRRDDLARRRRLAGGLFARRYRRPRKALELCRFCSRRRTPLAAVGGLRSSSSARALPALKTPRRRQPGKTGRRPRHSQGGRGWPVLESGPASFGRRVDGRGGSGSDCRIFARPCYSVRFHGSADHPTFFDRLEVGATSIRALVALAGSDFDRTSAGGFRVPQEPRLARSRPLLSACPWARLLHND